MKDYKISSEGIKKIAKNIFQWGYSNYINDDLFKAVKDYKEEESLLPPPAYKLTTIS